MLPPIPVQEAYSPEAADDARVVSRIGNEVRDRMQQVLDAMRRRRRSFFFGSIFDGGDVVADPAGLTGLGEPLAPTSRPCETTAT